MNFFLPKAKKEILHEQNNSWGILQYVIVGLLVTCSISTHCQSWLVAISWK